MLRLVVRYTPKRREVEEFLQEFPLVVRAVDYEFVKRGICKVQLGVPLDDLPEFLEGVKQDGLSVKLLDTNSQFAVCSISNPKGDRMPSCCIKAGNRYLSDIREKPTKPELNFALFDLGIRCLPWMPCSLKCKESLKYVKLWLKLCREINSKVAEQILEVLSQEVVWSSNKGIVFIEHPWFYVAYNSDIPGKVRIVCKATRK